MLVISNFHYVTHLFHLIWSLLQETIGDVGAQAVRYRAQHFSGRNRQYNTTSFSVSAVSTCTKLDNISAAPYQLKSSTTQIHKTTQIKSADSPHESFQDPGVERKGRRQYANRQ